MTFYTPKAVFILAACAALGTPFAMTALYAHDEQQRILQIQTDKRAIVLKPLPLDDTQVRAFAAGRRGCLDQEIREAVRGAAAADQAAFH